MCIPYTPHGVESNVSYGMGKPSASLTISLLTLFFSTHTVQYVQYVHIRRLGLSLFKDLDRAVPSESEI